MEPREVVGDEEVFRLLLIGLLAFFLKNRPEHAESLRQKFVLLTTLIYFWYAYRHD